MSMHAKNQESAPEQGVVSLCGRDGGDPCLKLSPVPGWGGADSPQITEYGARQPWISAGMDFRSLPNGHPMVIIYNYSKYSEIELVTTVVAKKVLPKLERVMAIHGWLKELRTDNGSPFHSQEMARLHEIQQYTILMDNFQAIASHNVG
ncbi:hypothetical protein NDU88_013010 [Pleurodeles waltl]|uniref:Integrase catalytic domain-containing protein n=1 Tax=Pleurodeles waltl TaxID=8319 RepID=A0AAV7R7Q7_PLEWA|nr:hypothetical protein NDU88_013010 [Pleurodeles waltl]